jgi:hypothetical protein
LASAGDVLCGLALPETVGTDSGTEMILVILRMDDSCHADQCFLNQVESPILSWELVPQLLVRRE